MKAYSYFNNYNEYCGLVNCQRSPLEPGKYLIPGHATTIKPLKNIKEGYTQVFDESLKQWKEVIDNRGKIIYNVNDSRNISSMTSNLYQVVPEGYTLVVPPDNEKHYIFDGTVWSEYVPTREEMTKKYDQTTEQYLYDVRVDRGYTKREPNEYKGSPIPRWAQDAEDWILFFNSVMKYNIDTQNRHLEYGDGPTIEEFLANMPKIKWSYSDS